MNNRWRVRFGYTFNVGNYESMRYDVEVDVMEHQSWQEAMDSLIDNFWDYIHERQEKVDKVIEKTTKLLKGERTP